MHLGVQIEPQFDYSYAEIRDIARECEQTGFRNLWVSDHFFWQPDSTNDSCLEAWTLLSALAVDTTAVRIGPMVSCQSYRNPALLAKIAGGVDHISRGRLEFGIGAGWNEREHLAYGYAFSPPGVRIGQLLDTIAICRKMWSEDRATHEGRYYRVKDALCAPKPMQAPLPMWIGGTKPRILRAAARHAQWYNHVGSPTIFDHGEKKAELDRICADVGRDPATLQRSAFLVVVVAETQSEIDALVAAHPFARGARNAAEARERRPGFILGTADEVGARLDEFRALGTGHLNLMFPRRREIESLRLLAPFARTLAAH